MVVLTEAYRGREIHFAEALLVFLNNRPAVGRAERLPELAGHHDPLVAVRTHAITLLGPPSEHPFDLEATVRCVGIRGRVDLKLTGLQRRLGRVIECREL